MADVLDDSRARIEILVNTVTEAHQAHAAVLVLDLSDEAVDIRYLTDFIQHANHRLVGAAVRWTPQAGDARGDRRIRIGAGRTGQPDCRGGGILLVIGM